MTNYEPYYGPGRYVVRCEWCSAPFYSKDAATTHARSCADNPNESEAPEQDMPTPEKKKIYVHLTEVEVFALAEFFGESGEMDDDTHQRLFKKFFVTAAKAGLYDESEWV